MSKIGATKKLRKKKNPFSSRKQFADWLWLLIIKAKANFTCEISGYDYEEVVLNAHHIAGKSTMSLRYSILNGICISNGIHNFDAHSTDYIRRKRFEDKVKELRGKKIYESLEIIAKEPDPDIQEVINDLLEYAKTYRQEIEQFYVDKYKGKPEGKKYEYLFEQLEGLE